MHLIQKSVKSMYHNFASETIGISCVSPITNPLQTSVHLTLGYRYTSGITTKLSSRAFVAFLLMDFWHWCCQAVVLLVSVVQMFSALSLLHVSH